MSVVFFHRANDFTGSTRALANLIELEYASQQVKVAAIDVQGSGFLSELPNVQILSIAYPTIKGKRIPLLSYCISVLHQFFIAIRLSLSYDTFYVNTIAPYPSMVAARLTSRKLIIHVHEKYSRPNWEIKLCEWLLKHLICKRIFVSEYVLNSYGFTQDDNNIVKYNRLPNSFLHKVHIQSRERTPSTVIMICSYTKAKGIYTFMELAKRLPQYQFQLVLSATQSSLGEDVLSHSLPHLKVLPVQNDVHELLNKADLLLNLSIPELSIETFGLTILEAMAYHIPAIVPNIGGPVELVKDGYNGFCVDVTNIEELAAKVTTIFNPSNYKQFVDHTAHQFNQINR